LDPVRAKLLAEELKGKKVGGWQVLRCVGSGKSAVVFKAVKGEKKGALKVFDPELILGLGKEKQMERVSRELSLVGKHHANLIDIYDGGYCKETEKIYVAMKFLPVPNLSQKLTAIPRDRIRGIISGVASAAQFLETLQLAHRDIKPENIAVTKFFKAILLDLGVIRPIGAGKSLDYEQAKHFLGTLQYSSPEYLFRKEEDSVDGWRALTFYQLGAVLHDLIMRKPLFEEYKDPFSQLVLAVKDIVPEINDPDVDSDLCLLARNCLVKDWRIRLQIVSWEDFRGGRKRGVSLKDIKKRIHGRQLAGRSRPSSSLSKERQALKSEQVVGEVLVALQEMIRSECIQNRRFFPRIRICDGANTAQNHGNFAVIFESAEEHALSEEMTVFVNATLLSYHSRVIKLEFASALSSEGIVPMDFSQKKFRTFYRGVFDSEKISESVNILLFALLDQAQEVSRIKSKRKSALWLSPSFLKKGE
jgi:serine/threonine protein kinase